MATAISEQIIIDEPRREIESKGIPKFEQRQKNTSRYGNVFLAFGKSSGVLYGKPFAIYFIK